MRVMANGAAFAHRLVLKNKRPCLLPMALGAGFVQPRHRKPGRRLVDLQPVRVVALNAIHPAFDDLVMLRELEFAVNVEVALETSGRVFAGIDDELSPAPAHFDVPAPRAMTRFTTALPRHRGIFHVKPRVRAPGKNPHVFSVAVGARLVAHVMRARNFQRNGHFPRRGGAGIEQDTRDTHNTADQYWNNDAHFFRLRFRARNGRSPQRLLVVAAGLCPAPGESGGTPLPAVVVFVAGAAAAAFSISFAINSEKFPPKGIVV